MAWLLETLLLRNTDLMDIRNMPKRIPGIHQKEYLVFVPANTKYPFLSILSPLKNHTGKCMKRLFNLSKQKIKTGKNLDRTIIITTFAVTRKQEVTFA